MARERKRRKTRFAIFVDLLVFFFFIRQFFNIFHSIAFGGWADLPKKEVQKEEGRREAKEESEPSSLSIPLERLLLKKN